MRLFVFLLFAALSAFGADVAGTRKATWRSDNGPREVVFVFEVHEGKLSGVASDSDGKAPITEGKVDGDKINFTVATEDFTAILTGTVAGDEMKLNAVVGNRSYDLPAKRVKQ